MASSMARGRRRRVLNEELLSGAAFGVRAVGAEADDVAPRYGECACLENHPRISDLVPHRKRAWLAIALAGASVAAGAAAVVHYAEQIAARLPGVPANSLIEHLAGGLVNWTSATMLMALALVARLIHGLRRHRVDDLQGRYRIWRWVALAGVFGSVNAVLNVHRLFAAALTAATGWSLSAGGAEWWLAPFTIVAAWMFARTALEVRESRGALAIVVLAGACYAAAAAGALGLAPTAVGVTGDVVSGGMSLVGHSLALAGLVAFANYVILDVQGLVDHSPKPQAVQPPSDESRAVAAAPASVKREITPPAAKSTPDAAPAATKPAPPVIAAKLAAPAADSWEADEDLEDEQYSSRKLSKTEKKRLRKQNRAA